MAVFVLVHGAVVGGWCRRWVAPHLRAAGHDVHAPTPTGLGERVHLASPRIGLDTHIQDVVNVLHYRDLSGVVLVGWSYGGMVVPGVADRVPERIAHVVDLDSGVPRNGETSARPVFTPCGKRCPEPKAMDGGSRSRPPGRKRCF